MSQVIDRFCSHCGHPLGVDYWCIPLLSDLTAMMHDDPVMNLPIEVVLACSESCANAARYTIEGARAKRRDRGLSR